jgi:hypothetical protein
MPVAPPAAIETKFENYSNEDSSKPAVITLVNKSDYDSAKLEYQGNDFCPTESIATEGCKQGEPIKAKKTCKLRMYQDSCPAYSGEVKIKSPIKDTFYLRRI